MREEIVQFQQFQFFLTLRQIVREKKLYNFLSHYDTFFALQYSSNYDTFLILRHTLYIKKKDMYCEGAPD